MPTNDLTANQYYELPHIDNDLEYDVARIRSAFSAIDVDINDILGKLGTSHATLDTLQEIGDAILAHTGSTANPHGVTAAQVGLANVTNALQLVASQNLSDVPDKAAALASLGALAATLKGAANGVAELDSGGKIPAAQLPSFVDDVLEFADVASFPGTGESSKIYIDMSETTNNAYRWSGSAYVQISASPGSTDAVPEGATNKYFTEARVRSTPLTGLNTDSGADVVAGDTVIQALGKLQKRTLSKGIRGTVTNVTESEGAFDIDFNGGVFFNLDITDNTVIHDIEIVDSIKTTDFGSNTSGALNWPAGLQENDVVFCFAGTDTNNSIDFAGAAAAGWTVVDPGTYGSEATRVAYKRMTSTPDGALTVTGISVASVGLVIALRNVHESSIFEAGGVVPSPGGSGMPNPWSAGGGASLAAGTMVLAVGFLDDDNVAGSVTAPAGYINLSAVQSSTTGQTGMIATKTLSADGTENPGAFGGAGTDEWVSYSIAIKRKDPTAATRNVTFSNLPSPNERGEFYVTLDIESTLGALNFPAEWVGISSFVAGQTDLILGWDGANMNVELADVTTWGDALVVPEISDSFLLDCSASNVFELTIIRPTVGTPPSIYEVTESTGASMASTASNGDITIVFAADAGSDNIDTCVGNNTGSYEIHGFGFAGDSEYGIFYQRQYGGGDSSIDASGDNVAAAITISGAEMSTLSFSKPATGTSGSPQAPPVHGVRDGELILAVGIIDNEIISTGVTVSNMTTVVDIGSGSGVSLFVAHATKSGDGDFTPDVFSGGGDNAWAAVTIVIGDYSANPAVQRTINLTNIIDGISEYLLKVNNPSNLPVAVVAGSNVALVSDADFSSDRLNRMIVDSASGAQISV